MLVTCIIIGYTVTKITALTILNIKLKPTARLCLTGIVIFIQTKFARMVPMNKPKYAVKYAKEITPINITKIESADSLHRMPNNKIKMNDGIKQ